MISGFERFRAGQFGIRHYCTIGLNPKEANNEALAEAVIDALPRFLVKEGVVAMGELGYDEQTPLEDKALRTQIELAKEFALPIMIHTPHRDKRAGTLRTMDVLKEHKFDPARCVIDHNNEETIREVFDRGYWCAFSIYPQTKMGSERMHEQYVDAMALYANAAAEMLKFTEDGDSQHLGEAHRMDVTASEDMLRVGEVLWPGQYKPH